MVVSNAPTSGIVEAPVKVTVEILEPGAKGVEVLPDERHAIALRRQRSEEVLPVVPVASMATMPTPSAGPSNSNS